MKLGGGSGFGYCLGPDPAVRRKKLLLTLYFGVSLGELMGCWRSNLGQPYAVHHPSCYTISLVSKTIFIKEFSEWISDEGSGKYEESWSFSPAGKSGWLLGPVLGS